MNPGLIKTFEAGAAIGANRIVTLNAAGKVVAAEDSYAEPIGVVQHACSAGDRVDVQMSGIVDVALGGTVTPGSTVSAGAQGVATASDPGCLVAGVALESGNTGEVVPVMFAMHRGPASDPWAILFCRSASGEVANGHIVSIGNGGIAQATAANQKLIGVSVNDALTDEDISWVAYGHALTIAGETIAPGDYITSDASGHGVVANTSTDNIVGIALASATSGQEIDLLVMPNHVRPSATTDGDDDDDDDDTAGGGGNDNAGGGDNVGGGE